MDRSKSVSSSNSKQYNRGSRSSEMATPPPFPPTQQPAVDPEDDSDGQPTYEMATATTPITPQPQQRPQKRQHLLQQLEIQQDLMYQPTRTCDCQSYYQDRHNHHHHRRQHRGDRYDRRNRRALPPPQQQALDQQQLAVRQQQQQRPRIGGPIGAALGGPVHGPIGAAFWVVGSPFRLGYWGVTTAAEKSRAKSQNQAQEKEVVPERRAEFLEERSPRVDRERKSMSREKV